MLRLRGVTAIIVDIPGVHSTAMIATFVLGCATDRGHDGDDPHLQDDEQSRTQGDGLPVHAGMIRPAAAPVIREYTYPRQIQRPDLPAGAQQTHRPRIAAASEGYT